MEQEIPAYCMNWGSFFVVYFYRDLDDQVEIVERSKRDGAYIVVTENELQTPRFRELISDLPAPKLALNGSGGASATNIARLLGYDHRAWLHREEQALELILTYI